MKRLSRGRSLAIPVLAVLTTWAVTAGVAHADTIDPIGVGGLFPSPSVPKGHGTMFETYPDLLTWRLDTDFDTFDVLDPVLHTIADVLMVLLVTIGAAVATLAGWTFGMTDLPEVQKPLAEAISGSAGAVMAGVFPAALAIGALVAFMRSQRGDGGGFSDLAWVLVSAVAAATLLQSPQTWVDGVDQGRMLGTDIAMTATDAGIGSAGGGIEKVPFALATPTRYSGDAQDRVVRRATDTVWRVYVAQPWCLAEFGSLTACQRYGREVLDRGSDMDKRKDYLEEEVTDDDVGDESLAWREGHRPMARAGVLLVAVPVALLFGLLLITLLFGSIAAMMAALFLLVVGPLFAALWVIPGRPRQWGMRWFDALVGTIMQSAIVTLTAGGVMMIQMVTAMAMPTYGWLGSSALSIAGAIAAFKYRGVLTSIVGGGGAAGAGAASMGALLGAMATRGVGRQAARAAGATGRGIGRAGRAAGRGAGRLADAIEEHGPQPDDPPSAGPTRPVRRPTPPPPPPAGGRPPRPGPGTGPGRGPAAGGTGPRATVAAAGRRAGRAATDTTDTPPLPPGASVPKPARPRTGSGRLEKPDPARGDAEAALPPAARTVRPRTPGGRPATQPPAPRARAPRAAAPPPRTPQTPTPPRPPRPGRRYPPPPR
ncbi:hypothetical protein [Streptomyces sp. NPDC089919]|uniref:hypothetical protein n=1 Tax=Streptomyces sp. NPDC089919 TaxID=3155188 RepID=UPI00341A703F